jgi:hypothetical protein
MGTRRTNECHDRAGLANRLLLRRQAASSADVATEALAGALDLIAGLGGGRVKGSPSSEDQQDTGSVQRPAEVLVEHGYREGEFAVPRRIAKPTFDEAVSHRTVLCRGLAHRTLPNSCRK